MNKWKATQKFKDLGIENCYQKLDTDDYFDLMYGKTVELKEPPEHLLAGKYIEKVGVKNGD